MHIILKIDPNTLVSSMDLLINQMNEGDWGNIFLGMLKIGVLRTMIMIPQLDNNLKLRKITMILLIM